MALQNVFRTPQAWLPIDDKLCEYYALNMSLSYAPSALYGVLYKIVDEVNDTNLWPRHKNKLELIFLAYTACGLYGNSALTRPLSTTIVNIGWVYVLAYPLRFCNVDLGNRDWIYTKTFLLTLPKLFLRRKEAFSFMRALTKWKATSILVYLIFNLALDNVLGMDEEYSLKKIV